MPTYAILQNPGHNRVYFNASRVLSQHELHIVSRRFTAPLHQIREACLGGVPYLLFDTEAKLTNEDLIRLSRLSFVYAIFNAENNGAILTPLNKEQYYFLNEDISTILKYTGKTNELFTRLMLNLALAASSFDCDADIRILDPVSGKGTTLFESLLVGCHAYGVEIDAQLAHEAYVFFKRYLETARYKHSTHTEKVGGCEQDGTKFSAVRYAFEFAKNKEDKKTRALCAEIIAGDTRHMNTYYKKNTFHAIVGDLPYGVQHGSGEKKQKSGITRNAMSLLTEALPEWLKVLMPGGVVVLAWNLFLIPRPDMEALFTAHHLTLPEDEAYGGLSHRVDQAIERDVIVGIKT